MLDLRGACLQVAECSSTHVWLCSPPRLAGWKLDVELCLMAVAPTTTHNAVLLIVVIALTLQVSLTGADACSAPKRVKNTKENQFLERLSYEVNSHLRYMCKDGYKRQAGTSNLAICIFDSTSNKSSWKYGNISCIRDSSVSITTPSITHTLPTTSGSRSSHVFTSSSSKIDRLTTMLSTPAVKTHETLHTSKAKVAQLPQDPGSTLTVKLTTMNDYTTLGQTTDSPGLRSSHVTSSSRKIERYTPTFSTPVVKTHETLRTTKAKVTQDPKRTSTIKQTTMDDYTTSDSPERNMWQRTETIGGIGGMFIGGIILIILIIVFRKCRKRSSQPYISDIQVPLQQANTQSSSSATHKYEQESTLL